MRRVAVVGATGMVGTVMLEVLREREFLADEIVPFATERSAGKEVQGLTVRALNDSADISGFEIVLFSAASQTRGLPMKTSASRTAPRRSPE